LIFLALFLAVSNPMVTPVRAETDPEVQPYIDLLKETMPEEQRLKDEEAKDYTKRQQDELSQDPKAELLAPSESYIDRIRETDPEKGKTTDGFLENERVKIGVREEKSAIQAVKDGKSELKVDIDTEIKGAGGVRIGASVARNISAANQARAFTDVYTNSWDPDVTIVYELRPFHSEWLGSLGIQTSLGITWFRGLGVFDTAPNRPAELGGGSYGTASMTKFGFITLPLTVAPIYRFNILRVLRPYASAGASFVPYFETRDDGGATRRGFSFSLQISGGLALALDYLDKKAAWDLFNDQGVKHIYLYAEYLKTIPIGSDVALDSSGFYGGILVEY
jgi:hypothetical protein